METQTREKPSKVQELLKVVKDGVKKIHSSEEWKAWLDATSKFWKYSFCNQRLIWWQKPEATYVAGYRTWLTLGRHVKRGESGISILAPNLVKVPIKNGEGKEELIPVARSFRAVSVFDISQTEGKELPSIYHPLAGMKAEGLLQRLTAFIIEKGYTVEVGKTLDEDTYGYVNTRKKEIVLKYGESTDQQALTLAHEISHALLNHADSFQNRNEKELEAETSAWIICRNLGLRTDETSFAYLATWVDEPEREKKLEKAATRACDVAALILQGLQNMKPLVT